MTKIKAIWRFGHKNHRFAAVIDPLMYMTVVWLHTVFITTNCRCIS